VGTQNFSPAFTFLIHPTVVNVKRLKIKTFIKMEPGQQELVPE
jgi:hypothetical protein